MGEKFKIEEIKADDTIENKTIAFLKNDKYRNEIIEEGIQYLLNNEDKHDDLYDFKNQPVLHEKFRKSINDHFNWIIAFSSNKYKENAKLKNCIKNDIKLKCTYKYFYNFLNTIDITPPSLKTNLAHFFTHLEGKYCSQLKLDL